MEGGAPPDLFERAGELAKAAPELPQGVDELKPEPPPCGAKRWSIEVASNLDDGAVYCTGRVHLTGPGRGTVHEDCPLVTKSRHRARIAAERERLKGVIAWIEKDGGPGSAMTFDAYDENRIEGGKDALKAMRGFAKATPPTRRVLLTGSTGGGKTRLFIAAFFAHLQAGVDAEYITAKELRDLFRQDAMREDGERDRMPAKLRRLYRAQVVYLDELGNVDGDQRGRGLFVEGFHAMLDRMAGTIAVATNLSRDEMTKHPDVGPKVMSRLFAGAYVVAMKGRDSRLNGTTWAGAVGKPPAGGDRRTGQDRRGNN